MIQATTQSCTSADIPMRALVEEQFGWSEIQAGAGTVWFRGYIHDRKPSTLASEAADLSKDTVGAWLDGLDGHYSVIVLQPGFAFAASDPVRSFPLIWTVRGGSVLVTHDGPKLERRLGLGPEDIDPTSARAMALSGFTIGKRTLYSDIRQIGPGEYLWVDRSGAQPGRYHRWTPWLPDRTETEDLLDELSSLNRRLIDDLVKSANGRTILVPLSAGLDSRFIASGLREAGYDRVRCVAYGLSGNREAVTSREIARRLGYEWTFVPYTQQSMRRTFKSPDYAKYKSYSDSLTSIHFPQEYRMLKVMREEHGLDRDSIVVNGQAGDFIAGNHIPDALFEPATTVDERLDRIISGLLGKHYKHWRALQTTVRLNEVKQALREEIDAVGGLADPDGDHGVYEYCEFQDRQSKYVLNGQRTYEYFEHEWRLPLWDRSYMDFWARAPLASKKRERLYKDVLRRDNWGRVWQDIPINPMRVRPGWLRPIRIAAKIFHAPLGKERWHKFERRYFDYWMVATCGYAAWPYWQVVRDRRGFYSAFGLHIADYLESKGLDWTGKVAANEHGR